jgi:hypothetical protein
VLDPMYAYPSRSLGAAPAPVLREVPDNALYDFEAYLDDEADLAVTAPPAVVKAMLGSGSVLQDEMLLAPFLDTYDLLWLSESAPWLVPYRNQLAEVKVKRWCDSRTAAVVLMQKRLHTIRFGKVDAVMAHYRRARALDCGEAVVNLARSVTGLWLS